MYGERAKPSRHLFGLCSVLQKFQHQQTPCYGCYYARVRNSRKQDTDQHQVERTETMSESILSGKSGIFPCPSCGQMIYSDSETCRFCSATVDRQVAAAGSELQSRVNTACNQA